MQQEILDIINKSLPPHLSESLRTQLNEFSELKVRFEALNKIYKDIEIKYKELSERFINLQNHSKTYQELEAKIKELDSKERNQQIFELKTNLEAEKRVSKSVYDLCDTVFKNRQFVHNQYSNETYNKNYDCNANYTKTNSVNTTVEEK